MRTLIKILLVLSLWWTATVPAVAAAMGCCEPETPCCLVQGLGRGCSVCPPAALHPSALWPPVAEPGHREVVATRMLVLLEEGIDDIWRPPMVAGPKSLSFVQPIWKSS